MRERSQRKEGKKKDALRQDGSAPDNPGLKHWFNVVESSLLLIHFVFKTLLWFMALLSSIVVSSFKPTWLGQHEQSQ